MKEKIDHKLRETDLFDFLLQIKKKRNINWLTQQYIEIKFSIRNNDNFNSDSQISGNKIVCLYVKLISRNSQGHSLEANIDKKLENMCI